MATRIYCDGCAGELTPDTRRQVETIVHVNRRGYDATPSASYRGDLCPSCADRLLRVSNPANWWTDKEGECSACLK